MENRNTILNELREIAPALAGLDFVNIYTVPENYFNQLTHTIVSAIERENLLNTAKENKYTTPVGYFDRLAEKIIYKINNQADELATIAPLLNSIDKNNVYTVPENYFINFKSRQPVNVQRKAKIISISSVRKLVSYAAAAVLTGVLITGAFVYTNTHKNTFDLSAEVNKISDEELQGYLSSNNTLRPNLIQEENNSLLNKEVPDVKENLKFATDEELQEYLKENEIINKQNEKAKTDS